MMAGLSKKTDKNGFTLAELLIVVAIIGILVAIAIPIFNNQMEKAREAYDIDTMRSAASAAIDYYYAGIKDSASADKAGFKWWPDSSGKGNDNAAGAYNPQNGTFVPDKSMVPSYGKGTTRNGGTSFILGNSRGAYAPDQDYTKAVVMVAIYPGGDNPHVDVFWKTNKGGNNYVGGQHTSNVPKYSIQIPLD